MVRMLEEVIHGRGPVRGATLHLFLKYEAILRQLLNPIL